MAYGLKAYSCHPLSQGIYSYSSFLLSQGIYSYIRLIEKNVQGICFIFTTQKITDCLYVISASTIF